MIEKLFVTAFLLLSSFGCENFKASSGAVPSAPIQKPTVECVEAKAQVSDLLKKQFPNLLVLNGFIEDTECAVFLVNPIASLTYPALKVIKSVSGDFSRFYVDPKFYVDHGVDAVAGEKTFVPIAVGEYQNLWVPVLDPSTGKALDTTETLAECALASQQFQKAFPKAFVTTMSSRKSQTNRNCFVNAYFDSDEDFAEFFNWKNPYSFDGTQTLMHFQRKTGVIATVWIHVVRAANSKIANSKIANSKIADSKTANSKIPAYNGER